MRLKAWMIAAGLFLWIPASGYAGEADALYVKALQAARGGRVDFAFMYYSELERKYPNSRYREEALFAKGEYYYQLPGYAEAGKIFNTLIRDYPKSPSSLFALAYLYKIAEATQDTESLEQLKKDIVAFQQVGLIFKESKEYKYPSPLHSAYRAVVRIDTMEFYRGGELFVTVAY